MSATPSHFQFRLSTLLVLMFYTAITLGINLVPRQRTAFVNCEPMEDGTWKNVEDIRFSVQGWPYYFRISNISISKTLIWKGSKEEMEARKKSCIKFPVDAYSADIFAITGEFDEVVKNGIYSKQATLINVLAYGCGLLMLFLILEYKWLRSRIASINER